MLEHSQNILGPAINRQQLHDDCAPNIYITNCMRPRAVPSDFYNTSTMYTTYLFKTFRDSSGLVSLRNWTDHVSKYLIFLPVFYHGYAPMTWTNGNRVFYDIILLAYWHFSSVKKDIQGYHNSQRAKNSFGWYTVLIASNVKSPHRSPICNKTYWRSMCAKMGLFAFFSQTVSFIIKLGQIKTVSYAIMNKKV